MEIEKVNIFGVNICVMHFEDALKKIDEFIACGGSHYVCFSNVYTVMTGKDNDDFRQIINEADLALADGMPLVWVAKLLGFNQQGRVYGPDVMLALCQRSVHKGYSHFFFGGKEDIPEILAKKLSERFPGLKIAGCYSPPFRPLSFDEDEEVVKMIDDSKAHILWVGLGTPKQEYWMANHLGRIKVPVMLGVGAAFDFHSGSVKQAAKWIQNIGLEWLFRLFTEPRRLLKRYLYNNPRFIYHISKQLLSKYLKSKLARNGEQIDL